MMQSCRLQASKRKKPGGSSSSTRISVSNGSSNGASPSSDSSCGSGRAAEPADEAAGVTAPATARPGDGTLDSQQLQGEADADEAFNVLTGAADAASGEFLVASRDGTAGTRLIATHASNLNLRSTVVR